MKRYLSIIAFIAISLSGIHCVNSDAAKSKQVTDSIPVKKVVLKDTINIAAVGDVMLGSAFPSKANLPADDAKGSFDAVKDLLKGDIIFGNLEGCLLNQGNSDKCKGSKNCYAFRMPERYVNIIKQAGFNLMSVANNHVGDFGTRGRKRTAALLDSIGINYAGLLSHPSTIFEKDSVKYGFCAFAPNEGTVSIHDLENAANIIKALKKECDIVIVSFHGGGEGSRFQRVTRETERFYGENRGNVYRFAHNAIDAGADIIIGQGPHVTRAIEVYKDKLIAYSLGNFCTYGMFNLDGPNGFAPLMNIRIDRKGNFIDAHVTSIKQHKYKGMSLDSTARAYKKMQELTDVDFPGHQLHFDENGLITRKTVL